MFYAVLPFVLHVISRIGILEMRCQILETLDGFFLVHYTYSNGVYYIYIICTAVFL